MQKKIQKIKSSNPSNRGKPRDIQKTKLDVPMIWTNLHECSTIIKFLHDEGRHIGLHSAGRDDKNEKKLEIKAELKMKSIFFEIVQNVAAELFDIEKVQAKLTVFFFKSRNEQSFQYFNKDLQQQDRKFQDIVRSMFFLLNKKFLDDWIFITKMQNEGKDVIQEMLKGKHNPKEFSQIFQNAYIKHILDDMINNKQIEKYRNNTENLEQDFLEFVNLESTKQQVIYFITQLQQFCNINQNDEYQEDCQQIEIEDQFQSVSNFFQTDNLCYEFDSVIYQG